MTTLNDRQLIAKEVIDQINNFGLVAQGTYCSGKIFRPLVLTAENQSEAIDQIMKHCTVCGLGACMLAAVRLYDRFPLNQFFVYSDMVHIFQPTAKSYLVQFFSNRQLGLIESAFERSENFGSKEAAAFGRQFPNHKLRLIKIMENIIANDGEFKP